MRFLLETRLPAIKESEALPQSAPHGFARKNTPLFVFGNASKVLQDTQ